MFLSPPHMSGEERHLVEEAFDSNWIAPTGPFVTAFENDLATLTGIPYVAALASGTAALHLALRMSDVGPGDEVWGSTMTFIGGVAPIRYQGAEPVFLDVVEDTMNLDLDLLADELDRADRAGRPPKVVITTDLYGLTVDPARMARLRDRHGFVWISDAAESVGSTRGGAHAGVGADFTVFSFNGNKIITTSGGGALACAQADRIDEARFLSTQAREPAAHYEHRVFGYNYRLSNVCAAIGVGQLRALPDRVVARRRVHAGYRALMDRMPGVTFSPEAEGERANRWLTTVRIDPRAAGFTPEEARLALEAENIESRPVWKPMHLQPVFAEARSVGGDRAKRAFEHGLCLPSGSQMTDADQERVVGLLQALRNERRAA